MKIINSLNPYKGGNDGLWQLHMLDINDKHRGLVAVAGSNESVTIDFSKFIPDDWPAEFREMRETMSVALRPGYRCPIEDGDVIYRIARDMIGKGDDHPQILLAPAFNEPGIIECEPIMPTLQQLGSLVENTVMLFDDFFPKGMPIHANQPPRPAAEPLAVTALASGYSNVPASKYEIDLASGTTTPVLEDSPEAGDPTPDATPET